MCLMLWLSPGCAPGTKVDSADPVPASPSLSKIESAQKPSPSPFSGADEKVLQKVRKAAFGAANPRLLESYKQKITVNIGTYLARQAGVKIPAPNPETTPSPTGGAASQPSPTAQPRVRQSYEITTAAVYPLKSIIWTQHGTESVFNIVNGGDGWKVTKSPEFQVPTMKAMAKLGASSQHESMINSIQGLLYLIGNGKIDAQKVSLKRVPGYWVIETDFENTKAEYFFAEDTFRCDKLVRRGDRFELTTFYSDYKSERGVMLPHKLEMKLPDGQSFATHLIKKWDLGQTWPDELFTTSGVREF